MDFDIWVDADSVPKNLRSIILKASSRLGVPCTFVADRPLPDVRQYMADETGSLRAKAKEDGVAEMEALKTIRSRIAMTVVQTGADSADDFIVEKAGDSSLCITHDIPLASRLLEKGCTVIDDRGKEYTASDIRSLLADRAVNAELRTWGVFAEQQGRIGVSSQKAFADSFDRATTRLRNR